MQLRFATDLSAEEYVQREAWKDVKLEKLPDSSGRWLWL